MNTPHQTSANGFRDYYELMQLSPNADTDTIDRIYHVLVKRYHPDNQSSGNLDKFTALLEAYRVLSDPDKRLAYDVQYEENRANMLRIFDETSSGDDFQNDRRISDGVLSLLYVARRRDPNRAGMGTVQMERLLGCPSEHLEFHIWYLLEKKWLQRESNGMLAITAAGVDRVIEGNALIVRRDRMIAETTAPEGDRTEAQIPPAPNRLPSGETQQTDRARELQFSHH